MAAAATASAARRRRWPSARLARRRSRGRDALGLPSRGSAAAERHSPHAMATAAAAAAAAAVDAATAWAIRCVVVNVRELFLQASDRDRAQWPRRVHGPMAAAVSAAAATLSTATWSAAMAAAAAGPASSIRSQRPARDTVTPSTSSCQCLCQLPAAKLVMHQCIDRIDFNQSIFSMRCASLCISKILHSLEKDGSLIRGHILTHCLPLSPDRHPSTRSR